MPDHDDHGDTHGSPLFDEPAAAAPARPRSSGGRRRGRRRSGCLPILVVLTIVVVGGWFFVRSIDLSNPFADGPAEDFPGPGSGAVTFTVSAGDSISVQARNLADLGVVASSAAYVEAAEADAAASTIQEGVYQVREEMKAADVVDLLAGGTTRGASFTFTAGKTVDEIVGLLVQDTDVTRKQLNAALADPAAIGLPEAAEGSAEGYLSPGSYVFFPEDDAVTILSAMVARSVQTFDEVGLAAAAERLGYSEHDLVTIASLVQAEGSLLDEPGKAKIARVIYNRLEIPGNPSAGFLQLDATVNYVLGEKVAKLTFAQIDAVADSPYNTYKTKGLPPGPIATPSADALEAALNPAKGPWFYYVTVNLRTGETKFATTPEEFSVIEAEFDEYCATQSDRC
ncbi:endolytic transglycosylase MltG [Nocardioides litoris]|uniref:endolytic transglycosylase MltG n=1 Tax=Nocardioides litoris TaxID=1926648 RepID=UPI001122A5CF|nr:endolytic transglycosylase MltG [Nocardioides litoris]